MTPELSALIARWHEQQRAGKTLSLTDLCTDCPEQIPLLRRHLEAVRAMEQLIVLDTSGGAAGPEVSGATLPYQGGTAPNDTVRTAPPISSCPPDYEILGVLGRGGMGVVYRARQLRLNRVVALKMILAGGHAGQEDHDRFLDEARAVAGLHHPHIVSLLEFGEYQGLPFFTLELVPGGSLAQRLEQTPLPERQAAQLLEQLARGIQHAHGQGIVHRDLKPANVLLDEDGTPKITDFGLARRVEVGSGLTASGAVLGTPSYMAPEQARGETRHAGPAADVYGLGAILYECLTGRPPFRAATTVDTILQVLDQEPVPVRELQPHVSVDLATICHKCLQKEPHRRYATALEVAEDCAAFLAGKPIRARPVGRIERAWRWCRRNPTVAGLLALVVLTLATGVVVATALALRAETARQGEQAHAEAESLARQEAQDAHRDVRRQLIDLSGASGLTAARDGDHSLALLWCARAVALARDEPELQELNRIRVTAWQRRVWQPQVHGRVPGFRINQDRFRTFQLSPTGAHLLALTDRNACWVWDCRQGQPVSLPASTAGSTAAAWVPGEGLLAVVGPDGRIQLLSPPAFQPVEEVQALGDVSVLALSGDGRLLAWGGKHGARVWDRPKREYLGPLLAHPSPVRTLAFSAAGRLLATSADDGKARVFPLDAESGEPLFPPVPHVRHEHGLAHGGPDRVAPRFAAEDEVLLTVEETGEHTHRLVWRSAQTGKVLTSRSGGESSKETTAARTIASQPRIANPRAEQGFLPAFAVSPDGSQVAVMGEDSGQLWDAAGQQLLGTIALGRYNWCEDVAFTSDGKAVVTAAHNLRAQLWSVDSRSNGQLEPAAPPLVQSSKLVRAAPSPDGRLLALALWDGTISVWRRPEGLPLAYSLPAGGVTLPVLSPDGRLLVPGSTTYRNATQRVTRVYQADTGQPAGPLLDPGGILLNAVFSPDGACLATASSGAQTIAERQGRLFQPDGRGGSVQLWSWKTGQRLLPPIAMPTEPRGLAFHPEGKTLAAVCADYRIVLVDPRTRARTRELDPGVHTRPFNANLWWGNGEARYSPDGRFLVTWEMARPVHVWDTETGRLLHTLPHNERVESVAFSPSDPTILATAGRDSVVHVWDLKTGASLAALQHPSHTSRVQLSPDGEELFTAGADGMLRVWRWRTGKLAEALALHPQGGVMDFAFSADRRWLLTLGLNDLVLTDWPSRTPAGPIWPLGSSIQLAVKLPAGDSRAVLGGFRGCLDGYNLEALTRPAAGPAEDLLLQAELTAGRRILESGQVVPLESSEFALRWDRLPALSRAAREGRDSSVDQGRPEP